MPIVIIAFGTFPKSLGKGAGRVGKMSTNQDYADNSIVKINWNSEKSRDDKRRLAVTKTSVKDY